MHRQVYCRPGHHAHLLDAAEGTVSEGSGGRDLLSMAVERPALQQLSNAAARASLHVKQP